jgi:arsenite transporter
MILQDTESNEGEFTGHDEVLEETSLGFFESYLTIWVALSICCGIGLGFLFPKPFEIISKWQYASINFLICVLIWAMVYPMMVDVDFNSITNIWMKPKGIVITLVVNWLLQPFTMAGLGILFFDFIFVNEISRYDAKEIYSGLVILGAAPCTAMVFLWSELANGDPNYTLVQVAVNDVIMIFVFAPTVALLLNAADIVIPWDTLLLSVLLYIIIPLIAGSITRKIITRSRSRSRSSDKLLIKNFVRLMKPISGCGLLLTVTLLFGFRASMIIDNPVLILMIACPIFIQTYTIFFIAYVTAFLWSVPYSVAAPASLIGCSNFFELSVAVAISLFGLKSLAALATVVGVLVEVPVMLSLVKFCLCTSKFFRKVETEIETEIEITYTDRERETIR